MILKRSLLFKCGCTGWEKVRNLPLSQSQHVANLGPEELSLSLASMNFPGNSVARLETLQPSDSPLPFADAWSFMIKTQALKAFVCDKKQNSVTFSMREGVQKSGRFVFLVTHFLHFITLWLVAASQGWRAGHQCCWSRSKLWTRRGTPQLCQSVNNELYTNEGTVVRVRASRKKFPFHFYFYV